MGAYSLYPREINIYFLQGGVIYILYRESSERGRRNE